MKLQAYVPIIFVVLCLLLFTTNVFFTHLTKGVLNIHNVGEKYVSTLNNSTNSIRSVPFMTSYYSTVKLQEDPKPGDGFSKWWTTYGQPELLTVPMVGRLGNQMFQYASLLGISSRNGKRPYIKRYSLLKTLYNVSYDDDIKSKTWPQVEEGRYAAYDPQFEKLPRGNITILMYFQSWRYFHHIGDLIRTEFQFSKTYYKMGLKSFKYHTASFGNRTVIALHVRRADMARKAATLKGFTTAPVSYIRKAISHMKAKFRSPVFLIATDDKKWCNEHLRSNDTVIMVNKNQFVDFVALTFCDHMIMTVGTFGWWAAYLIDGYTVYYKDFPRARSTLSRGFVQHDYFLPHWIPIGS